MRRFWDTLIEPVLEILQPKSIERFEKLTIFPNHT